MMVDGDNKLRFWRSEVGICTLKLINLAVWYFCSMELHAHSCLNGRLGMAKSISFLGQSISWQDFIFLKTHPTYMEGTHYVEEQHCSSILQTKRVLNLTSYVCEVCKLWFFLDHDFAIQQFPSYPVDISTTKSITDSHLSRYLSLTKF